MPIEELLHGLKVIAQRNLYTCLGVVFPKACSDCVSYSALGRIPDRGPGSCLRMVHKWGSWHCGVPPSPQDEAAPELLSFSWELWLLVPGRSGCNFPHMVGNWFSQATPGNSWHKPQLPCPPTGLLPCLHFKNEEQKWGQMPPLVADPLHVQQQLPQHLSGRGWE